MAGPDPATQSRRVRAAKRVTGSLTLACWVAASGAAMEIIFDWSNTMQDLFHNITVAAAIPPISVADNTAQVSNIIDRRGYESLTFAIATGSLADADATFTVLVEDGDTANLSDAAAVADADLLGTEAAASFTFAADNAARKIGYVGAKRYVRLTITPAANASAALIGALAILGHPANAPTTNP